MDFWKYNIGDEITAKGAFGLNNVYRVIERRTEFTTKRREALLFDKSSLLYTLWNATKGTISIMNEIDVDSLAISDGATIKRNVANTLNATVKKNDVNVPKQTNEKSNAVNHPSYYQGKIEVIDFIDDKNLGFNLGNCVKYISRAGKKNPEKFLEDLEKARWYLNREISRIKKESEWLPNTTCVMKKGE